MPLAGAWVLPDGDTRIATVLDGTLCVDGTADPDGLPDQLRRAIATEQQFLASANRELRDLRPRGRTGRQPAGMPVPAWPPLVIPVPVNHGHGEPTDSALRLARQLAGLLESWSQTEAERIRLHRLHSDYLSRHPNLAPTALPALEVLGQPPRDLPPGWPPPAAGSQPRLATARPLPSGS